MRMKWLFFLLILTMVLIAACAPEDLDITPTPTATPQPSPTPTPDAASQAAAQNLEDTLTAILTSAPNTIQAGVTNWTVNKEEYGRVRGLQEGIGNSLLLSDAVGGGARITYAIFESEEAAEANYERIRGIRPSLEQGESHEEFPEPNLFGSNQLGTNAILRVGNIFIEVNVEIFSSSGGDPLPPLASAALEILEEGLAKVEDQ